MIKFTIHHYETVESTMDIAREKILSSDAHGAVIVAQNQEKGRGRYGREWVSPKGNLYVTLCLKPDCSLTKASELSFVSAIAVGEVLKEVLPKNIHLVYKWPNDILVNSKKVSGILLEAQTKNADQLLGVIVGIGINCVAYPDQAMIPATSLLEMGADAKEISPQKLLERVLEKYAFFYDQWMKKGFDPIRKIWIEAAKGINEPILVRLHNEELKGLFKDIDAQGALLLETENETKRITAGDVFFKS